MHEARLVYSHFLAGKYLHGVRSHPIASYMGQRGARVRTNQFDGSECPPSGDLRKDLTSIVRAGRVQEFERLIVEFDSDEVEWAQFKWRPIQAIERVLAHCERVDGKLRLIIYFPDIVWLEATYWHGKARTTLHERYMDQRELDEVAAIFSVKELTPAQRAVVFKALDLPVPNDS